MATEGNGKVLADQTGNGVNARLDEAGTPGPLRPTVTPMKRPAAKQFRTPQERLKSAFKTPAAKFTGRKAMTARPPRRRSAWATPGAVALKREFRQEEQEYEEMKSTQLPIKYTQLLQIFGDLVFIHRLRRNRQQLLTFADAKRTMQTSMKRAFTIKELAQLKHLYPEGIQWENVLTKRGASASERLVIRLQPPNSSKGGTESDRIMKREMRKRLVDMASTVEGPDAPEIPQAQLPDNSIANLRTPTGATPYSAMSCTPRSTRSRKMFASGSVDRKTQAKPCGDQAEKGPAVRRSLFPETPGGRANVLTPVAEGQEDLAEKETTAKKTPGGDKSNTDLNFELSPSMAQMLNETVRDRELMNVENVNARKQSQAIGMLPRTFDQVRAIFRKTHATRRPLHLVLAQLKKTMGGSNVSDDSVRLHLQQLLEHASGFVKLEKSGNKNQSVLIMDDACNLKAIRDHLKTVAEARPAVGGADEGTMQE